MKPGSEYEKFVYEKFKKHYSGFSVKLNDRILGQESRINREIDISIRGKFKDANLLYLVQCKDHARPANITTIGEFSSVIRDVRASKGFLVCAAGFAKTIHDYARAHGIELLSVESITSRKWSTSIEIPLLYIKSESRFNVEFEMVANQE